MRFGRRRGAGPSARRGPAQRLTGTRNSSAPAADRWRGVPVPPAPSGPDGSFDVVVTAAPFDVGREATEAFVSGRRCGVRGDTRHTGEPSALQRSAQVRL